MGVGRNRMVNYGKLVIPNNRLPSQVYEWFQYLCFRQAQLCGVKVMLRIYMDCKPLLVTSSQVFSFSSVFQLVAVLLLCHIHSLVFFLFRFNPVVMSVKENRARQ